MKAKIPAELGELITETFLNGIFRELGDNECSIDTFVDDFSESEIERFKSYGVTGIRCVDSDGMEYDGQDGYEIYELVGLDAFFEVEGVYYSHHGTDRESGWTEVFPKEVTITVYKSAKDFNNDAI